MFAVITEIDFYSQPALLSVCSLSNTVGGGFASVSQLPWDLLSEQGGEAGR